MIIPRGTVPQFCKNLTSSARICSSRRRSVSFFSYLFLPLSRLLANRLLRLCRSLPGGFHFARFGFDGSFGADLFGLGLADGLLRSLLTDFPGRCLVGLLGNSLGNFA